MTTLHHVTLTSGHVRESPRGAVRDDILALLRPLIVRALRGEHVEVPGVEPRCTMTGGVSVRASRRPSPARVGPRGRHIPARAPTYAESIALTIWGPPDAAGIRPPVTTIGIAPSSSGADQVWRELHSRTAGVNVVTSAEATPVAPWCAARIDIGAVLHPEAMGWMGDLERCLAWAWVSGEQ